MFLSVLIITAFIPVANIAVAILLVIGFLVKFVHNVLKKLTGVE